jgi:hypothetical protein
MSRIEMVCNYEFGTHQDRLQGTVLLIVALSAIWIMFSLYDDYERKKDLRLFDK